MTLGLANMRALMEALDRPERAFRSVVVAGTNGKGSVTAFLSALLSAGGVHTGWFSSPHVYSVRERIKIDGEPVSIDEMEAAAARVTPLYDRIGYSYFEALTAIAYQLFAAQGVEVAVLETGLGGRFDATNVVEPEISVLTSIGLDHRRILGDTEEEILREKLGIARPGGVLLTGPLAPGLAAIVEARAQRDDIRHYPIDALGSIEIRSLGFDGMRALVKTPRADYGEVTLPFVGRHQASNALLAISAAEAILDGPVLVAEGAARTYMPGRFEVLDCGAKRLVLDVAHNDDALLATLETLAAISPREENAMVLGILRRKEFLRFPAEFAKWVRRLYLIEPIVELRYPPRAAPGYNAACPAPEALRRIGLEHVRDRALDVIMTPAFDDPPALRRFMERLLSPSTPVSAALIAGSHHTVDHVGRALHEMGVF